MSFVRFWTVKNRTELAGGPSVYEVVKSQYSQYMFCFPLSPSSVKWLTFSLQLETFTS